MYNNENRFSARKITMIGMFGAISAILMLLEFPIPFSPTFVKMDFSDLPVILGGYMMGPLAGFMIILIKIVLNFILNGTVTMGIGELANMICSISYMLPAVLIYRKLKTKKGAVISLLAATFIVSFAAIAANLFLTFPAYAKLMGMKMETIIAMGTATNPLVKDMFSLMICSMLPFNLFKYAVVSVITFYLYKRTKNRLF